MLSADRDPRIVIIGAGMSGIACAVAFQRAGFQHFSILEKGSDVGGVWHWNRYPGLTCDVPSQMYQYSFAPKPDWPRLFATGEQIQRYHREVIEQFGLAQHLRLNTEVVSAELIGTRWRLQTADGAEHEADFLIGATGALHHPFIPDIPGLNSFGGEIVHTARWPADVATEGRRIAVIGTGSTGVQVVSALQPRALELTQFTRTPQWVAWSPMQARQPAVLTAVLRRFPAALNAMYNAIQWGAGFYVKVVTRPTMRRRVVQAYVRLSLTMGLKDRQLRRQLTPDYQPMCKRQVLSSTYYRAVQAPNTNVVTEPITEITPVGIRTDDGRHHVVDLIVLATGFHTHNYMRPMQLRGRDGVPIDEVWAKGPRAYRMTAIPGFPNFFMVLGPNSPTASISLHYTAELTAQYIVQWLQRFRAGEFSTVEVSEQATAAFNDAVAEALGPTVWNTGCNSWYLTEDGAVDLWPFDRATLAKLLRQPDDRDFLFTTSVST